VASKSRPLSPPSQAPARSAVVKIEGQELTERERLYASGNRKRDNGEIAKHYYSVPHQLIRQEVEARITAATVEIFYRGKRVASHRGSARPHRPTTVAEHMPSSHRRYRDWTHERIRREAAAVGDNTAILADVILRSRPHPEQGFRSCIGIIGLVRRYGAERVDAACARALVLGTRSYSSIAAILKNHRENASPPIGEAPILIHENIRGPGYYH
jgi:transposase